MYVIQSCKKCIKHDETVYLTYKKIYSLNKYTYILMYIPEEFVKELVNSNVSINVFEIKLNKNNSIVIYANKLVKYEILFHFKSL